MNETLQLLLDRKSVRAFSGPLSEDDKNLILAACLRAPTAGNQMLYTIVDVTDQGLKTTLAELCDRQSFIAQAPLVLIFLADCRKWHDLYTWAGAMPRDPGPADLILGIQDAVIAAQSAVVAADSLGLGSCYIGDIVEHREQLIDLLHLDSWVFPATMLVIGPPTPQQKTRPQPPRFSRRFVIQENAYHRLTEADGIALLKEGRPNEKLEPSVYVKTFCERKYHSEFSREMNRSVRGYLKAFKPTETSGAEAP